jgi:hypothetical protein
MIGGKQRIATVHRQRVLISLLRRSPGVYAVIVSKRGIHKERRLYSHCSGNVTNINIP